MGKIVITEDMVRKASSYLPLTDKVRFVEACAGECVTKVPIKLTEPFEEALPDMYIEDSFKKSRCLMGAFVKHYLGTSVSPDNGTWFLENSVYDEWAGSHVFNQLERMKKNADLKDGIFDLLSDYRELEKKLNAAVYGMLNVMNDPVSRFLEKMALENSKEALDARMQELQKVSEELEKISRERKERDRDTGGEESAEA